MSNVAFLLIVLVIGGFGSLYVWLRQRRPTTFTSSIDQFQREMAALGRDSDHESHDSRSDAEAGERRPIAPAARPAGLAEKLSQARRLGAADHSPHRGGSAFEAERVVDVDGDW